MKLSGKWIFFPLVLLVFMSCATVGPKTERSLRQAVLNAGEKYINVPYASPPNVPKNFDCSGFVKYAFGQVSSMSLPSSTGAYLNIGREIDFKDARHGDLLIFASQPGGSKVDHVAILYKKSQSGELRGSWLLHAVSISIKSAAIKGNPNTDGVKIGELGKRGDGNWQNEYFLSRYMATRRVIDG